MEPAPLDTLLHAFAEVARDRLMRREPVELPGVGTLRVRHEPSRVREDADGTRMLLPPHDVIVFEPAADDAS